MKQFVFAIFYFCCMLIHAQSHYPEIGEVIKFYPVNEDVKNNDHGFDCFYDAELSVKNGKFSAKSKFRFMVNKEGLTPFEEFEGHTFTVNAVNHPKLELDYLGTSYNGKAVFLMTLTREDGKSVVMRIPFYEEKNLSRLTASMCLTYSPYSHDASLLTDKAIIIPYYRVDEFQWITEALCNKSISFFPHCKNKEFEKRAVKSLSYYTSLINNANFGENFDNGDYLEASNIEFINIKSFLFKQPVLICSYYNKSVLLPVHRFYSRANFADYNDFSIILLFDDSESYFQNLIKEKGAEYTIQRHKGKYVYYGYGKQYPSTSHISIISAFSKDGQHVVGLGGTYALEKGKYKCIAFDYDNVLGIYAILEDENKCSFRIPIRYPISQWNASSYINFSDAFFSEYEAQQEIEKISKQEQDRIATYERLKRNYGLKYADELINLRPDILDLFDKNAKKWGKNTAYSILHKEVYLGWSQEKCRASWGEPTHVNRSTGSWGVHEQWVYRYEYPATGMAPDTKYLYFENGKLSSYDD